MTKQDKLEKAIDAISYVLGACADIPSEDVNGLCYADKILKGWSRVKELIEEDIRLYEEGLDECRMHDEGEYRGMKSAAKSILDFMKSIEEGK